MGQGEQSCIHVWEWVICTYRALTGEHRVLLRTFQHGLPRSLEHKYNVHVDLQMRKEDT